MRLYISKILFASLFLLLPMTIRAIEWQKYKVNNAFTFEIPNTIELRMDQDLYTKIVKENFGYMINADKLVFQQKNLSSMDSRALLNRYCRIIVGYQKGQVNEFLSSHDDYTLQVEDIESVKSVIESDCGTGLLSIEYIRYENNVSFSGVMTKYRRKGFAENLPVIVKYCLIYNSDEMVSLVLSYREEEAILWKNDFERVISSFKWVEKKISKSSDNENFDPKDDEVSVPEERHNDALKGFLCFFLLFCIFLFLVKKRSKK